MESEDFIGRTRVDRVQERQRDQLADFGVAGREMRLDDADERPRGFTAGASLDGTLSRAVHRSAQPRRHLRHEQVG